METSDDFPPQEDGFERLWTPHRMAYVRGGENQPTSPDPDHCPFCKAIKKTDEEALIVHRGKFNYCLLNLYPYNSGHALVVPYRHEALITGLNDEEFEEFHKMVRSTMKTLQEVKHPDGFNLGINQNKVAGAGIAAHLHQHIIPRWLGDANFFPLVAQTRTIGELLTETRKTLAENWVD